MNARDEQLNPQLEVTEVIAIDPIREAPVSDIVETMPGCVVAVDTAREDAPHAESPDQEQLSTQAPHRNGDLRHVIECMLFVATDPLGAKHFAEALEIEEAAVEEAVNSLEAALDSGSGLRLMRVAGGYQICTRPEYADYCAMILQPAKKKLSKAALETLAVVAYRRAVHHAGGGGGAWSLR